MDGTFKACENCRSQKLFGLVQLLNNLVHLVKVEELLRQIVRHPEIFALQNQRLLIELRLFESLNKLEYILALALEHVSLVHRVDNLVLIDERLLQVRILRLYKHFLQLNLNVECLSAAGSCGHYLPADGKLRKVGLWGLHVLHVVLPLDFHVLLVEPLL